MTNLEKHSDQAALIGRILYSLMFLLFGYSKITAYAGIASYLGSLGVPAPSLVTLLAIVIEVGGGLLMLVGYQTRIVSLGLAIYVMVSAFIAHSQLGDPYHFLVFMKNMAIAGGSLAFFAFGGGAYSLDAKPEALKHLRIS
jgi:putative oxidoreductase